MPRRDVAIFVALAAAYSVVLALLIWAAPMSPSLAPQRWLVAVPVASVILAARGRAWPVKLAYALPALLSYALFDLLATSLGLRAVGNGDDAVTATAAMYLYELFGFAVPLVVLLMFVGRDPSVLWEPAAAEAVVGARAPRSGGRRPKKRRRK